MTPINNNQMSEELEDIEYFEVETNPIVDKLVNDFIKENIPNLFAHFSDTDENDAQRLRVRLSTLISHERAEGELRGRGLAMALLGSGDGYGYSYGYIVLEEDNESN
jgi:hypothetical protein